MQNLFLKLSVGFLFALFLFSCQKNNQTTPNDINIDSSKQAADIYVAGYEVINSIKVATLWKNGVPTHLTDGTRDAIASSVYVSGNNVYVVGTAPDAGDPYNRYPIATLWKNGVVQWFQSQYGDHFYSGANSIVVSGDNFYVAGYESVGPTNAMLWTNTSAVSLYSAATWGGDGSANSVILSGSDVYAAGNIDKSIKDAMLWKNGVAQRLSNGTNNGDAACVFVSGNDVYVAGQEEINTMSVATLWKNGAAQRLTNGNEYAYASSVAASGNDVYVVGCDGRYAFLWKNGAPQRLSNASFSYAFYVCLSGNDVYVAGDEIINSKAVATLWKNGVAQHLNNGDSTEAVPYAIFIK